MEGFIADEGMRGTKSEADQGDDLEDIFWTKFLMQMGWKFLR